MSPLPHLVQTFSHAWSTAMLRACWQGGLALGLAWILIRIWRSLPRAHQCWLWRLAFLKTLIVLIWAVPLCLPLLSPDPLSTVRFAARVRSVPEGESAVLAAQGPP